MRTLRVLVSTMVLVGGLGATVTNRAADADFLRELLGRAR